MLFAETVHRRKYQTSRNVTCGVLASIRAEPSRYGIDIDRNAAKSLCLGSASVIACLKWDTGLTFLSHD